MEQFDQWQDFWDKFLFNRYGKESVQSEDDLYFQVARTVNRRPVAREVLDNIIAQIVSELELNKQDVLVDFCCGNGLFTYELKDKVKQIIGVDFSKNIIDTANQFKAAGNITYQLGSVVEYMKTFGERWPGLRPDKYLMNDSLAYFSGADLETLLEEIKTVSPHFKFLLRGAPNDELKWNYYNTTERKENYRQLLAKGDLTNDGLGTWWKPEDIRNICERLGLDYQITNQQLPVSDYRMDVLVSR